MADTPLTPEEYAAQYRADQEGSTPSPGLDHLPEPDQEQDAVKDQTPALATVAPQFDQDTPEGVDQDSLPEFKDLRRMLPAQRIKAQADMAKLATDLPDKFREVDQDGQVNLNLDMADLTSEDLDGLVNMAETAQDIVLNGAKDRNAMEDWLLKQDSPMEAVMYAFTQYQARLGN